MKEQAGAEWPDWVVGFPGAVTVSNQEGAIAAMNPASARGFAARGGEQLLGSDLLACHPEPARSKLRALMEEKRTNVYTIEKGGVHKLVLQAPWFRGDPGVEFGGYVEIVVDIPAELPHFVRDKLE